MWVGPWALFAHQKCLALWPLLCKIQSVMMQLSNENDGTEMSWILLTNVMVTYVVGDDQKVVLE